MRTSSEVATSNGANGATRQGDRECAVGISGVGSGHSESSDSPASFFSVQLASFAEQDRRAQ